MLQGFLGGFKTQGTVTEKFNLHPVYMTGGFVVLGAEAMLGWRTFPLDHSWNKVCCDTY